MPELEEIINKNSIVRILDSKILHIKYGDNVELTAEDIEDVNKAFKKLGCNDTYKTLSEFHKYSTLSTEARHYAEKIKPQVKASAFVLHSLSQRILLRFYHKFQRNKNITRVFNSFEDALSWLNTIP
ncbi:MAG: hypothetical protein MK078_06020 [Crocinitomicaceae bacterium]|nr:hypothetical protein [Crocinitomicaceae bacterium]